MKNYINELWQYPSDHIFIGTEITFKNGERIKIISNNILNKKYMEWIIKNGQGLNNSIITQAHGLNIDKKNLDLREQAMITIIKKWMNFGIDIISLQDVSVDVRYSLINLSNNYSVFDYNTNEKDYCCILYNKNKIAAKNGKVKQYKEDKNKIINVLFYTENGNLFSFIDTHVPWKKFEQFTKYLEKPFYKHNNISYPLKGDNYSVIATGDFNTNIFDKNKLQPLTEGLNHITPDFIGSNSAVQYDWIVSVKKYEGNIQSFRKIEAFEMGMDYHTNLLNDFKNGNVLIFQTKNN
jgi:hypothetical protein